MGLSLDLLFFGLLTISIPVILSDRNNYGLELSLWDGPPLPHLMPCLPVGGGLYKFPSPYCQAFHLRSLPLRVSHLPGLCCILEGLPNLLSPEIACFPSFCWPSRLQSFSLTQYQIRLLPLPHPFHFPSQVPSSLPTCDCFLPPKWN